MSSLKDLASLIMVPSLYKDGELHTVKPLGNSILHPDATGNHDGTDGSTPAEGNFTFSRGSNLAATRVDVNGLIEKGRENAITYSNTFNTGWNAVNASVTSGQAGYDGSSDAWLLSKSAAHGNLNINLTSSSSEVHTFSLYAKANASEWMRMTIGSPRVNVFFNVADGTLGEVSPSAIDTNIESVGNGWYRCSFSTTYAAWVEILPAETMNDTGGTSGSLYIQDAQIEKGLVATDYIETGASTAQAGILEDMPRLDYSGSCPALLLEPQRTNKIAQSEYQVSLWYPSSTWTIEQNTSDLTSPEGKYNAVKLIETSANSYHSGYYNATIESSYTGTYTISAYAKYNGRFFVLNPYNTGIGRTYFNLQTGEVAQLGTNVTAGIEDAGNGWYRCYVTGTYSSSNVTFEHMLASAVGTLIYQGDGTSGAYIYGCQAEAGSYPTSYIPTYGSSVTRSNDYKQLDNLISLGLVSNDTFTYFAELNCENIIRDSSSLAIQIGSNAQRILFYNSSSTAARRFEIFIQDGTTQTYTLTADVSKICISVQPNLIKVYENGVNVLTTTQNLDLTSNSNYRMYGDNRAFSLKQDVFFPTALTDSECIALTTI